MNRRNPLIALGLTVSLLVGAQEAAADHSNREPIWLDLPVTDVHAERLHLGQMINNLYFLDTSNYQLDAIVVHGRPYSHGPVRLSVGGHRSARYHLRGAESVRIAAPVRVGSWNLYLGPDAGVRRITAILTPRRAIVRNLPNREYDRRYAHQCRGANHPLIRQGRRDEGRSGHRDWDRLDRYVHRADRHRSGARGRHHNPLPRPQRIEASHNHADPQQPAGRERARSADHGHRNNVAARHADNSPRSSNNSQNSSQNSAEDRQRDQNRDRRNSDRRNADRRNS